VRGVLRRAQGVRAIVPCGHVCVCEACAEQLTKTRTPMCPFCCGPIQRVRVRVRVSTKVASAFNWRGNIFLTRRLLGVSLVAFYH
jgi:hypothetical protein